MQLPEKLHESFTHILGATVPCFQVQHTALRLHLSYLLSSTALRLTMNSARFAALLTLTAAPHYVCYYSTHQTA